MKPPRAFHPDLRDCMLEDRLTPVIPNLGVIALTTYGYVLITPFPGAFGSTSGAGPYYGLSSGVSGTPYNLPFFIMGMGGISSALPGAITGFPGLSAATANAASSVAVQINVGSGALDTSLGSIPVVTRNTIANDRGNPVPSFGGQALGAAAALSRSSSSGVRPVAPARPGFPEPAPEPSPEIPPPSAPGGPSMPQPGGSLNSPFSRVPPLFPGGLPQPGMPPVPFPGGPSLSLPRPAESPGAQSPAGLAPGF